jgi:hypothetical protein
MPRGSVPSGTGPAVGDVVRAVELVLTDAIVGDPTTCEPDAAPPPQLRNANARNGTTRRMPTQTFEPDRQLLASCVPSIPGDRLPLHLACTRSRCAPRTVFFVIEGCIKADAVLTAGAAVFSVQVLARFLRQSFVVVGDRLCLVALLSTSLPSGHCRQDGSG